jgi:hypothetical protein
MFILIALAAPAILGSAALTVSTGQSSGALPHSSPSVTASKPVVLSVDLIDCEPADTQDPAPAAATR